MDFNLQDVTTKVMGSGNSGLTQAVSKIVSECGGVEGVIKKFSEHGMGAVVQSWIGKGPNQPVSPEQVNAALGSDLIAKVAGQLGMSNTDLSQKLSTYLPLLFDKLSPDGMIPHGGWWSTGLNKAKEFFGLH